MRADESIQKKDPGVAPSESAREKLESVFEQFEMMALHQGATGFNHFNDGQKDRIIDVMEKNESHAYDYHVKKLEAGKEIKIARINAHAYNKKTDRIVIVAGLILAGSITIITLLFKEAYFNVWLAFITGLFGGGLGGYGYAKSKKSGMDTEGG